MMVTELEAFSLVPGVTKEQFLQLEDAIQSWSYLHRRGLQRRTTLRSEDGSWLVLTLWGDAKFAVELDTTIDATEVTAWHAALDRASYRRKIYELLA